jgi:WD40 repeat protein
MLVVGDHDGPVTALTFMPDGARLVSGGKDGHVRLWDLHGGPARSIERSSCPVVSVSIDSAGSHIAIACDRSGRLFHLNQPEPAVMSTSERPLTAVTFLAGGQWFAIGIGNRDDTAEAGVVSVWRTKDRKLMDSHNEPTGVWALAAAAEHKFLAWSTGTRRVAVRDLTRPDAHVFPALKKSATTLAMSPDVQWLAAGDDWSIRVWDIARRDDKANLIGHKGRVLALAFTPDGRHLLSGAGDQKIITWDIATGQQEHVVDWDLGRVTSLAISPDGLLCAAGGDRGRAVVWDRDEV